MPYTLPLKNLQPGMVLYSPLGNFRPNTVVTENILDNILMMYPNHDDIRVNVKLYVDEEIRPVTNKLSPAVEKDIMDMVSAMIENAGAQKILSRGIMADINRIIPEVLLNIYAPGTTLIQALTFIADYDDYNTFSHSAGVMIKSVALANHLSKLGLIRISPQEAIDLGIGSLIHDIGKTAIDPAILNKNGPLLPPEREMVNRHPQMGYMMLRGGKMFSSRCVKGEFRSALEKILGGGRNPVLEPGGPTPAPLLAKNVYEIVLHHHQRWDGNGYGPEGSGKLFGKNIPPLVRVVAIADVCDAVLSRRPYKKARTPSEALNIIQNDSGKAFDPVFAGVLKDILVKHPIGEITLLDDGTIAIVDEVDPYRTDRPVCRSITGILDRKYATAPETINLATDPRRIVTDAVDIESLIEKLSKYLTVCSTNPMQMQEREAIPFMMTLSDDLSRHNLSFDTIARYILNNLHKKIEVMQAEAEANRGILAERIRQMEEDEAMARAVAVGDEARRRGADATRRAKTEPEEDCCERAIC